MHIPKRAHSKEHISKRALSKFQKKANSKKSIFQKERYPNKGSFQIRAHSKKGHIPKRAYSKKQDLELPTVVSVIFICAAICIGEMSSKVSFLFCSAPDGAFRVQTAAAARACVRNLKPWVPIIPVEGDFGVAILLGTSKSI